MARAHVKQLSEIFWTFFKIGSATFGGGYAMIPLIEGEVVGKREWVSPNEMSEVLSKAGSAPGGIGVNASAFIGYRLAGIPGAAAAVIGITFLPFLSHSSLASSLCKLNIIPKLQPL